MRRTTFTTISSVLLVIAAAGSARAQTAFEGQEPGTWLKLSPLDSTPPSPRLGYEGACAWDSWRRVLIRYGGHNQGGGGEQGSEVWTFDPLTAEWTLHEPNTSPPGICCGQQNVFDPVHGRYLRFPAFSGSHGWQWFREIYLNDSTLWSYDLATNTWRNLRPLPAPRVRPLRCASWDAEHQVVVLFGGEGSREGTQVYDPSTNTWTDMDPPVEPAPRSGGNMAYDARHRVHVLFGAQFTNDPHTWTYDLRKNEWRDRKPDGLPPTDRNDAVLTYDASGGVVLAIVKVTEGEGDEATSRLETWSYDVGANRWRQLRPPRGPDVSGNRARQLEFAPELGVALLENRTHPEEGPREQQIWAFRHGAPKERARPPLPPTDLGLRTAPGSATLTWTPSASTGVTHHVIYRGSGERPWEAEFREIATLPRSIGHFHDAGLTPGQAYIYFLRAMDGEGRQGEASVKMRARPAVVEDIVVSVLSARRVELDWSPPAGEPPRGYLIERAAVEVYTEDQLQRLKKRTPPLESPSVGAFRKVSAFETITPATVRAPPFVDVAIDLEALDATRPVGEAVFDRRLHAEHVDEEGRPYRFAVYAYRVRAVNLLGVAGGPSPAVLTIPSAPQYVFSREDGERCHLKWAPNPERGIAGYRVYRMDGRYNSAPIRRLSAEPLAAWTYTDPAAGTRTRRYYVVAIDALGQEGCPSAPVWSQREWRRFYEPFVGEWHQ